MSSSTSLPFDELQYLTANPDVRDAVSARRIRSGWDHYVAFGIQEGRTGVSSPWKAAIDRLQSREAELPVPPATLRERVHGQPDEATFRQSGQRIALELIQLLGLTPDSEDRVLDFGCGCSRIARHLASYSPGLTITGIDIDEQAIAWNQAHLSEIAQYVTVTEPPVPLPQESFDIIYGVSVFTHLPLDLEIRWLNELKRLLKPGGQLALTVHGSDLAMSSLSWLNRRRFHRHGHLYVEGKGTPGLPGFYQTSFHDAEYVKRAWGRQLGFTDIRVLDKAIGHHQDLVICRR